MVLDTWPKVMFEHYSEVSALILDAMRQVKVAWRQHLIMGEWVGEWVGG